MKNAILACLATGLLGIGTAKAQIELGVKAGFNLANVHVSDNSAGVDWKNKPDLNAGLMLNVPVVAGLSIQPEVVYSGQGSKFTSDFGNGKINNAVINVPVMIKYSFMGHSGPFIETGPQLGFLVSAKFKEPDGTTQDEKGSFKSTDFAWGVGLGYKLPLGLGIDARYNFGITNIVKKDADLSEAANDAKNGVFQVGLFWLFGGGGK